MRLNLEHMIPLETGQAIGRGWTAATDERPIGVTVHWSATWDLLTLRRILGGADALRKGRASAHFGVGRSRDEGVDQYVSLEDRSYHAGAGQTLEPDGRPLRSRAYSGARTTIGIEVVNVGYARKGVRAQGDWIEALSPNGRQEMKIQPWPSEQIAMIVELGRHIVDRWPHIGPESWHGHSDLCPGRKLDPVGFPFAEVLSRIYDREVVDIWSPFLNAEGRQRALISLGYDLGSWGADGDWGRASQAALEDFQEDHGLLDDGFWTASVSRSVHEALKRAGAWEVFSVSR